MAVALRDLRRLAEEHASDIEPGRAYRQVVFESNGRTFTRGKDDEARGLYGVTKTQVRALQNALRRSGISLDFDLVDALLTELVMTGRIDHWTELYAQAAGVEAKDTRTAKEKARDRKRRQRLKQREGGYCIIRYAGCLDIAVDGGVTCYACGQRVNEAKTPEGRRALEQLREGQAIGEALEHGQ